MAYSTIAWKATISRGDFVRGMSQRRYRRVTFAWCRVHVGPDYFRWLGLRDSGRDNQLIFRQFYFYTTSNGRETLPAADYVVRTVSFQRYLPL